MKERMNITPKTIDDKWMNGFMGKEMVGLVDRWIDGLMEKDNKVRREKISSTIPRNS